MVFYFMFKAVFQNFHSGTGWNAAFETPSDVYSAYEYSEVADVIISAEAAALNGKWVVLLLSYEAAPAFDSAFAVYATDHGQRTTDNVPLAAAAIFDKCSEIEILSRNNDFSLTDWKPFIAKNDYNSSIKKIKEFIAAGDTYQVNYTFPLESSFSGCGESWFNELCLAQRAPFSCFLDLGIFKILSLSPELFFERKNNKIITRPMKGTMPRGRWLEEDNELAQKLHNCPKNRAENLMIVDLIRNDLGRIAELNSVKVTDLYKVEKYETVFQMTSTIKADIKKQISNSCPASAAIDFQISKPKNFKTAGLFDILRALFPCGSITGAPKIRTMEIIRELEPYPRGFYTGAIGFIKPGGDCVFNVPIRTVQLDSESNKAVFSVGGGITYDSTAEEEYEECITKSLFLNSRSPEFQLLESLLLEDGKYFLLQNHLKRIASSAKYFDFVFDKKNLLEKLETVREKNKNGSFKIRLLLSRTGKIETTYSPLIKGERGLLKKITIASNPINTPNKFLYHKTTNRKVYKDAKKEFPDFDDVILWNEKGEVTESTIANLVIEKDGEKFTPPRCSGLLAGTFREELLKNGEIKEKIILKDELYSAGKIHLINSVRKWMPAELI